ncbi:cytochrome P450 4C1-like [Pararge aegeria]|uniref:cytochrome P450 4C1-like n=1 Tax=Pararge aegeria TaxID=116150 RepID=UPI0019D175AC|nr:cytochrome P450 4C1-like [Pararge aegeria]
MWAILVVITLLLSIWLQWIHKNRRLLGMAKKIPGPPALPILGNALKFMVQPQEFIKIINDLLMEYGDVLRVWLGTELNIIVSNPEDVKLLLTNNKINVKGPQYKYMADVLGGGILSGSGTPWRKHRKVAAPNYGKRAIENYTDIFNRETDLLLQKYAETPKGEEIDIYKYIVQTTSYIVCQTLMGLTRKEMIELPHLQYLIDESPRLYDIVFDRMTKWYLQLDLVFCLTQYYKQQKKYIRCMLEFSESIVKHRMEKLNFTKQSQKETINIDELTVEDSINSTQLSVIDRFILSEELDPSELLQETFTVFTSSQEATAKITSTVLLMMAFHPECQEKLYTEIVSVVGKKDIPITEDDIKQMPYLDMVFKEVIRLFPIAGLLQRTITEDITISNSTLPAGASLIIPMYHMHRDPKHWRNPDAFDPERFNPENMKTRNPYSYIPFSLGSMDCLGRYFAAKLVKTIVIRFMQNFKLATFQKYEDLRIMISISATTMDGFPAALTRRV